MITEATQISDAAKNCYIIDQLKHDGSNRRMVAYRSGIQNRTRFFWLCCNNSWKTAYATIKGFEIKRMIRRGHATISRACR